MGIVAVIDRCSRVLRNSMAATIAATVASTWKAGAQDVRPLYGVPVFSPAPPTPKYGMMPVPSVMYGPPPMPTGLPTPTPGLADRFILPILLGSIVFVIVCAVAGSLWLLKNGKGKK